MTTIFLSQDMQCGRPIVSPPADFSMFLMSPQSCGQTQNVGEAVIPSVAGPFLPGGDLVECGRSEEPFHNPLYPSEIPTAQQQIQFIPSQTRFSLFQEGYSQNMMTVVNPQTLSSHIPTPSGYPLTPVPGTVSPSLLQPLGASTFQYPSLLPLHPANVCMPFDQPQDPQQPPESSFACGKRQADEKYRYSIGTISKRVKQWLDKSKPFAAKAQENLEDSLARDASKSDCFDENFYELFDESRRKRIYSLFPDSVHVSASHSESSLSGSGMMTPTCMPSSFLLHATMYPETCGVLSCSSEDLHMTASCTEQEPLTKYPKMIPALCQTAGLKVHYDELTDRSVLRNWRCRTDEGDLLARRGRKRFFKRVAVLPPDTWQPNKRPQPWEWAPSGPFALNIGEYVSISGTNGYPYEIVLIRHIQPALRCFLSLIPAPPEVAQQMLNGELITPERPFIAHLPIDSVTHKWILNGVRPKEYTLELALSYVNKDVEAERAQKQERMAKKNQVFAPAKLSVLSSVALLPLSSLTPTSEDSCVQSTGCSDCIGSASVAAVPTTVMIDSLLQRKELA